MGNGIRGENPNHHGRSLLPCVGYCGLGATARYRRWPGCRWGGVGGLDTRVALIQALIPLGLRAVEEALQREVELPAGPRYARGDGAPDRVRWGRQRGSVYLLDHKVPVQVPPGAGPAAGGAGPSGELPEAATAAGGGRGDAAAGPVRAELPGLPGSGGGGTGSFRAEPLKRLPPVHPGDRT